MDTMISLAKNAATQFAKDKLTQKGESLQGQGPVVIEGLSSPLSLYSVVGVEAIHSPWCYEVTVTSSDKHIQAQDVLGQSVKFSFLPAMQLGHGSGSNKNKLDKLLGIGDLLSQASSISALPGQVSGVLNQASSAITSSTAQLDKLSGKLPGKAGQLLDKFNNKISSLDNVSQPRQLHGVVEGFSQLSVNKDEARYVIRIVPRLALLAAHKNSAIYQNQSVVSIVEEVLRKHGFTGVDYRLELKDNYPSREYITQWQESDLTFIQRLLADVGIWLRFEHHSQHNCDVVVISDNDKGYEDIGSLLYNEPSGMVDGMQESVWDLQYRSKLVSSDVKLQDYNYRAASSDMLAQSTIAQKSANSLSDQVDDKLGKGKVKGLGKGADNLSQQFNPLHDQMGDLLGLGKKNEPSQDKSHHGMDYRYGEHYKAKGDDKGDGIEGGSWYARLRHEQQRSEQFIIEGRSNCYRLSPGQLVKIDRCPLAGLSDSLVILSVNGSGDRTKAYEVSFTAIPYNELLSYRPAPLDWPQVSGTLTGRITSPDNDTYGYIDTQGRYRVKLAFDLGEWKKGEESLWVRLAKPYAGDTYGFHFPLIDGTEVAIAFTNGNPDRPYISNTLHDSDHPDHVTTENKHRNVIRTPANNKLRMDDKRDQEHIKLATEYGKTQLNLGHLVDSEKEKRGEGFELRTDEWGAIRAGKGLYITTEEQYQADGLQLQMDSAAKELEQAVYMVKQLNDLAQAAKAELADLQTQKQLLEQSLNDLKQPAILNYAPAGIADVTPASIQQTAGENIIQTAQSTVDISAFKRFMVTAGNMISLFANAMGIKIFAAKGKVEIQAQDDAMELTSKQDMKITSTDSEVIISASKKLTLACDGVAIVLEGGSIRLYAPGDVAALAASFGVVGPASYSAPAPQLPTGSTCAEKL